MANPVKLLLSALTQHAEPIPADGSINPLSVNAAGRLRVASKQAEFIAQSGQLVSVGDTLRVFVSDASNLVIHAKNIGTAAMAAGNFVFEGSIDSTDGLDGTWFSLQSVRSNANVVEASTGILGLTPDQGSPFAWELSVNAIKWFRIRCTTAVTAGSIANFTALRGSYASEPIPAMQPVTISGTVQTAGTAAISTPAGSIFQVITTASTNGQQIKNAAGNLFELTVTNPTTANVFVTLYNKATAPTVGTDVPIWSIPVSAGASVSFNFGQIGKRFPLGMGVAVTNAYAATDTTATQAGAVVHGTYI